MADELPGHYQQLATATAAGLTTGLLNEDANFVSVTSSSANNFVTLPSGYIGMELVGYIGANGVKLRTISGSSTKINNVDVSGGSAGAAIPATSRFVVRKVTATDWIVTTTTLAGAAGSTITPA